MALYLAVALVAVAVVGPRWLRGMPDVVKVMAVIVWGSAALQSLGTLVSLLVTGPAKRRRTVYEVTNYRVIVRAGSVKSRLTRLFQSGQAAVNPVTALQACGMRNRPAR